MSSVHFVIYFTFELCQYLASGASTCKSYAGSGNWHYFECGNGCCETDDNTANHPDEQECCGYDGTTAGIVAGSTLGGIIFISCIVFFVCYCFCSPKKRKKRMETSPESHTKSNRDMAHVPRFPPPYQSIVFPTQGYANRGPRSQGFVLHSKPGQKRKVELPTRTAPPEPAVYIEPAVTEKF